MPVFPALPFTAPKYSFVQPSTVQNECYPDPKVCMPCSDASNLSFQITASIDVNDLLLNYDVVQSKFYALLVPADTPCRVDWSGSPMGANFSPLSPVFRTAQIPGIYFNGAPVDTVLGNFDKAGDLHPWGFPDMIKVGECFKLQFIFDCLNHAGLIKKRYYMGCSNCFVRIPQDECYTSILSYSNPSDSFDFDYTLESSFMNKAELPIYLRDPMMENEQKVYTKSDGSIVKLYERKEEVYTLETDQMPYAWHKALDVGLSHDTVLISNPNTASFDPVNTATQFVKKENYEIEYNKAPLSALGKGSCKLSNANPIHLVSNNCE